MARSRTFFCPWTQGQVHRLALLVAFPDELLNGIPQPFEGYARGLEDPGSHTIPLRDEPHEDVFRPDQVMTHPESFPMGQLYHFFASFSEILPH